MAHLVVAYPTLSEKDLNWIQEYRRAHDQRYFTVVRPHFTLVFAIGDISQADFLTEARARAGGIKRFDVELKVATINLDDSGSYYHEFLVPETGHAALIKLHDKLYSGLFAKHLRLDIDFIPHIGIGNSNDAQESKRRIDELNAEEISIRGVVETLNVIEYKDGAVKTVEQIGLQ